MINRDLKWVLHSQYDVGLDLAFLDYRLEVKLDYYNDRSFGIIFRSVAQIHIPIHKQIVNANNAVNEGVELELQGDIFRPKNEEIFRSTL